MGYSRNPKTLEAGIQMGWFDQLLKGENCSWTVKDLDVETFAYKIREGLRIASIYPQRFPELAAAHGLFKIQVVDRETVQAIYRPRGTGTTASGVSGSVVVHGLEGGERAPTDVAGQQTAATVVQAWHNTQPSNTPMKFPNANMEREELIKLYDWAKKRTPAWYMFVAANGALTLMPATRDMAGLEWTPEDED